MPELPEVETVRRIILPQVQGQMIQSVDVHHAQVIACPDAITFSQRLIGQTFSDMQRRGKFLCFQMQSEDHLYVHLRMTGQLLVTLKDDPMEKHTHLVMNLSRGAQLRYIDVRRFGRFWLIGKDESDTGVGITELGIEPLSEDLTPAYLKAQMGKQRKPIKEVLMNQRLVAGIGNIYADEILFASGIHPQTRCESLMDQDWEKLAVVIPAKIQWAIAANQITPEEYLEGKGKEYRNTPGLQVYGHAGEACPQCQTVLERISIGGRGSTFCPVCQRERTET